MTEPGRLVFVGSRTEGFSEVFARVVTERVAGVFVRGEIERFGPHRGHLVGEFAAPLRFLEGVEEIVVSDLPQPAILED